MDGGAPSDNQRAGHDSTLFSARLADQFFRRWFFYLIPVVLLGVIGLQAGSGLVAEYSSTGTLNASANPLLVEPEARGTEFLRFESPAANAARLINEQLGTDAFVDKVAERAGLGAAVQSEAITHDQIRSHVRAGVRGENIVAVTARWTDPDSALTLVQTTIDVYVGDYVELVAADSREAVGFLTELQATAEERVEEAENELAIYLRSLDPVEDGAARPIEEVVAIERLSRALENATQDVEDAQDGIDAALLNERRAQGEAGRALRIVDPPEAPTRSVTGPADRAIRVVGFWVIGVIIALTALLVATVLDRSIRSRRELSLAAGTSIVASVPRLKRSERSQAA